MRSEFQLNEDELKQAAKQVGRAELKYKMNGWDKKGNNTATIKSIGFSWVKYAVAASFIGCLVWAGIVWNYKANIDVAKNKNENKSLPKLLLGSSDTSLQKVKVLNEQSLGFAFSEEANDTVKIIFINIDKQIKTIDSVITENVKGKASYSTSNIQLNKIKDSLMELKETALFDDKTLYLYTQPEKATIIKTSKRLTFLKSDSSFYYLRKSIKTMPLQKVVNALLIEQLNKIVDENF